MNTAQLTVVEGMEDSLNQVFLLNEKQEKLLGRSSVCPFQIVDPLISSLHCYFTFVQDTFMVYDLLSANGVLVNQVLVDFTPLKKGDRIKVGKTVLEFDLYEGEKEGKTYITGEKPNIQNVPERTHEEEIISSPRITLGRRIKKEKDLILCRLALKNHLLTHPQIWQALDLQEKFGSDITAVIVEKLALTDEDVAKLLHEHDYYKIRNKDIHLGRILLEQNFVKEEKVQEALSLQELCFKTKGDIPRLGEILVQQGCLTVKQNNAIIKSFANKNRNNNKDEKL